ncbi:ADL250Wp [Eremothecium gossypii ATCC 10895]|uniref:ADL250Wp n=1 Tax=Eremothecium gossypii (strain ATCC 10895 / CBS 109.51 / FGSC 9923 / NRRL Y-1056) TaxID=284811 RepID=Q75B27_EREGS|nr:ADL250Wp [Eremothecium gossypii ATCC 10895]AAS51670.1 ADL250Wp [Eremothecium gossypii ATCC 10895]AEY95967.1 FADL250Wp [Eremothecium gossypii FDAG1]
MYIPPLNFALVVSRDVSLYRSGYPMPLNYPFIKTRLQAGTVIYVGDKDISEEYKAFLESEQIRYHHIYMQSCRDDNIQESMEQVLRLVLNVDNYPILIHSNKGKHRVGVVVGIIRKLLQGWSVTGIYQEYGIFSGGQKDQADLEYITMFGTKLMVPMDKVPGFVQFIGTTPSTDYSSDLSA